MQEWLKGKKTYILVALGVLTLVVQFLSGDISFIEFVTSESVITLIELLGIGTLRAGVAAATKKG